MGGGPERSGQGGLAAAAMRPMNLAVLAAGGFAGALVHWPYAGAGLVAYLVAVAISSRAHAAPAAAGLAPPENKPLAVRSTEVMAHVVRIRKGHAAFHAVLRDAPPSLRELFVDSYGRMADVVRHAYDLALKADQLRAHLDRTPGASVLARDTGEASEVARERVENRRNLEAEYTRLSQQLAQVGSLLENWQGRVLNASTRAPSDAQSDSIELGEALSHMDVEVRVLSESVRL